MRQEFWDTLLCPSFPQHLETLCASKWCSTDQEMFSFMVYGDGQIVGEGHCNNMCCINMIQRIWQNYSEKK